MKTIAAIFVVLIYTLSTSTAFSAPPVCDVLAEACGTHGGSACEVYAERCG